LNNIIKEVDNLKNDPLQMGIIKILYVEDETFLGKIVKESLESRGFDVMMEDDGGRVLDQFKHYAPDICVLDVMLPNKSGFEVAEEIRELDADVPIIFLTAKTQTEDVVKGFKTGGNDYVRKPFSIEELIVRIENLLRLQANQNGTEAVADSIQLGRYQYLPNRQVLLLEKDEKKLSYRESELLKYLYQHRDKIIHRRDILLLLWGNDSFFNSRNLDVYITKLRSYFKEDASVEILTMKGIGYRFVAG
jgi:DNA-binding response OmpR family regulator